MRGQEGAESPEYGNFWSFKFVSVVTHIQGKEKEDEEPGKNRFHTFLYSYCPETGKLSKALVSSHA